MAINPMVASAAISAGSSAAQGIFGGIGARRRQRRQHKMNMQLADYQYSKNLDMWNHAWEKETAYNDPKAQMQRLKEAGINPHMAYNTGGVNNTASTGELPQYQAPQYKEPITGGEIAGSTLGNFVGQAGQLLNLMTMQNQLRQTKADADIKEMTAQVLSKSGMDAKTQKNYADTAKAKQDALIYNQYQASTGMSNYAHSKIENYKVSEEVAKLQKEGIISDNTVKAYKAGLAKAGIDPDSNPIVREVMKAMAGAGVPLNQMLIGLVKMIAGR